MSCYDPQGRNVSNYGFVPVNLGVGDGFVPCCLTPYVQYSGACFGPDDVLFRGGCTDPTFSSPNCPQFCLTGDITNNTNLIKMCPGSSNTACCDHRNGICECSPGSPGALYIDDYTIFPLPATTTTTKASNISSSLTMHSVTGSSGGRKDSWCTSCSYVFPLSLVGVINLPVTTDGATTFSTITQEIGSITVYENGAARGWFATALSNVIPNNPQSWSTSVGDMTEYFYAYSYISALSTVVSDYTAWQKVAASDFCMDSSNNTGLPSIATFLEGQLTLIKGKTGDTILGSAIRTQLPRPTCTKTTLEASTMSRNTPIFIATQTAATNVDAFELEFQVLVSANIAFSLLLGLAVSFTLAFLAFFFWKRKRTVHQHKRAFIPTRIKSKWIFFKAHRSYQETNNMTNPTSKIIAVHWRAPILMLVGLLSGLSLAVGHHLFYTSMNMQPTDGMSLSQAWIVRFGTLLALLVKICFTVTVGTSFVQFQWFKLRQKPRTVKEIDTLSSILSNILGCLDRTWLEYRRMVLLALVFWSLTLLPVLTPGTLIVKSLPHQEQALLEVPTPKFMSESNAEPWLWGNYSSIDGNRAVLTPSQALIQIYLPTALRAEIYPMVPQYPNQSFHLDFNGPAVNCSEADESLVVHLAQHFPMKRLHLSADDPHPFQTYYSWADGDEDWLLTGTSPANLNIGSPDSPSRLFMLYPNLPKPNPDTGLTHWLPAIIECSLYNASYSVDFRFQNSQQTLSTSVRFLNNIAWVSKDRYPGSIMGYLSLMAGLGDLLTGYISKIYFNTNGSSEVISNGVQKYTQVLYLTQVFANGLHSSVVTSGKAGFTANQTVTGNVTAYLVTYIYEPYGLIFTYGMAFVLTVFSAALGFYAFTVNKGSYQNLFSTFLRATKNAELIVDSEDEGADSCPMVLSTAKVKVTHGRSDDERWLLAPVEQFLLVPKPELSHRPSSWQRERSRQRDDFRSPESGEDPVGEISTSLEARRSQASAK